MNFTGYFKNKNDVSYFNSPNMESLFSALQTYCGLQESYCVGML